MNKLAKLYALQQEKARLAKEVKALDAEIKAMQHELPEGLSSDGEYVVDVKPRVMFDAATAKRNLSPALYESICEMKPTAVRAKEMLTGYEYADCQKVTGVIATVKLASNL